MRLFAVFGRDCKWIGVREVAATRSKTSWSSRLMQAGQGAVVIGTLGPALAGPQKAWPSDARDAVLGRLRSGTFSSGVARDRL